MSGDEQKVTRRDFFVAILGVLLGAAPGALQAAHNDAMVDDNVLATLIQELHGARAIPSPSSITAQSACLAKIQAHLQQCGHYAEFCLIANNAGVAAARSQDFDLAVEHFRIAIYRANELGLVPIQRLIVLANFAYAQYHRVALNRYAIPAVALSEIPLQLIEQLTQDVGEHYSSVSHGLEPCGVIPTEEWELLWARRGEEFGRFFVPPFVVIARVHLGLGRIAESILWFQRALEFQSQATKHLGLHANTYVGEATLLAMAQIAAGRGIEEALDTLAHLHGATDRALLAPKTIDHLLPQINYIESIVQGKNAEIEQSPNLQYAGMSQADFRFILIPATKHSEQIKKLFEGYGEQVLSAHKRALEAKNHPVSNHAKTLVELLSKHLLIKADQ